ncbi:MAG: class I SAM-dependent methyltransferase [Phycisphaerales bacterium]
MSSAPTASAPVPYREIYDRVIARHPGYNDATTSPGYRALFRAFDRLRGTSGPALDVGCGVGFAVQAMERHLGLESYGADVSETAVARARERLGAPHRVALIESGRIPFADALFGLVTCFDVLEHLEVSDIHVLLAELRRLLRPRGLLCLTIATRGSSSADHLGVNLHRTVQDAAWWRAVLKPDELVWDCRSDELLAFWTKPPAT